MIICEVFGIGVNILKLFVYILYVDFGGKVCICIVELMLYVNLIE